MRGIFHDGEDTQLRWVTRDGTSGEVDHGVADSINIPVYLIDIVFF